MRKGIKGMAALLCACMMLEMACGSVFAKQTEGDKAASTLEEAAPEVTAESDASTDAAETEAAEEQEAPAEEPESSPAGEAEDSTDTEPDSDVKPEAATGNGEAQGKENSPEMEKTPEAEDIPETEVAPEEDTSKAESIPGTDDAPETEDAGKAEDAPKSEDAQKTGDALGQENVPGEETPDAEITESGEAAEGPEGTEEAEGFAENGVAEVSQAGIEPIVEGTDYYVVWDGNSKLTFQDSRPNEGEQGINWWGYTMNTSFTGPDGTKEWHADDIKNRVTTVEFVSDIELDGQHMFQNFTALENVTGSGQVTLYGSSSNTYSGGNHMFSGCASLTTVDINLLVTKANTSLGSMFRECSSLTSLDLSKWSVLSSANINMSQMFYGCSALQSVNLTGWDTSAVSDISSIFEGCSSLETLIGLSNWDTSKVEVMSSIFKNCSSLTELDLLNWNTENAKNEKSYFSGCTSLRELTVGPHFRMGGEDTSAGDIHNSQNSGIWVSESDKNGPQWTDADLIKQFEGGTAGGTYIWVHTLTYDGSGAKGTAPTDSELYGYDEEAILKDKGDLIPNDQEIFVGWSEEFKGTIKSKDDEVGVLKPNNKLKFENANKKLYAVWAEDVNENGTPDYAEDKVTITFNINGGDGSKEKAPHNKTYTVTKLPGTSLIMSIYATLKWEKAWTKDGSPATHPAILAGWLESEETAKNIILENDMDDGGAGLSKQLINRSQAKAPGRDTTYYAVYAEDENGDHIVDYLENSVQVEYYANGGTRTDGKWVDKEKGIFYRCSHHHVHNEDGVVLMELEQGKAYVSRDGAVLLGWSEKQVENLVASDSQEKDADLITTVKMPAEGNKKVYAVWAEDRNKNGRSDYTETKVKLTFDIGDGDGSRDADHKTTFTVEALPGIEFDLPYYSEIHWIEEWEKDGQPADHPAVLAGWADHPISGIILEDDVNDKAETHAHLSDSILKQPHITVPTVDTTYYAVYGADENNDEEPDYMEYAEQVDYYANGGTMVSGSWLDGIDGLFYKCGHHHVKGEKVTLLRLERGKEMITRDSAVLLGWSAKAVELVTSAEVEANAGIITEYTMPEGDGKVYAVWAEDTNGNGTPDYEENIEPPKDESQEEKPPVEKPDHPYWSFYTGIYGASSVQNASAGWVQDANGWKYYYANGTYAASKWELIKGKWYYFKPNGYMMTGWQLIGGVWYHLDDSDGDMDTGWYFDQSDGRWYYLDTSGAMLTGWQLVSEKYYYLHEGTMAETGRPFGSMYANETTPDGYTVDASGAWVQ